jgi:hypothetical protein
MKSFMKSLSSNNFHFYDNLHKKYFEKAREEMKQSERHK